MEENERVGPLTEQYNTMSERCNELFFILRDMPRYGIRQWQVHFMKTFDAFTKLWKFQNVNRRQLQEEIQLKRYEIGEIASKIGQLYYHYYLYTSDLKYLDEAMDFYAAILERGYFKLAAGGGTKDVRLSGLRFLARYFVVALLLKNQILMSNILQHLQSDIDNLPEECSPEKVAWGLVIKEGVNFMDLDNKVTIFNQSNEVIHLKQRLIFHQSNIKKGLNLRNAIVIGGCDNQWKFSELTIDMFRVAQLMEYTLASSPATTEGERNINPLKYLLYKPSFDKTMAFLSAIYKDLPENSVLLFYISGDAARNSSDIKKSTITPRGAEKHCKEKFYPEDLGPFTRKPMFIIADIDKSESYQCIDTLFHEPRICLMAPAKVPDNVTSKRQGSIFTLFLFDPLLAICRLCNINRINELTWKECKAVIKKVGQLSIEMLLEAKVDIVNSFGKLLGDPFLHNIMSHFFICLFVFRLFKNSQGISYLPLCSPAVPREILDHKVLHRYMLDMLGLLDVRDMFLEHSQLPNLPL